MIRLQVLGSLALLHDDGAPVRSLLAQPKRFALLTFLAASPGPRAHPRDELLGVFWPERDEEHARRALRQALHGLRRSLGPGVILGKGEELLRVDGERLWCDVSAFARAVDEDRDEGALDLYRGPFLAGFHLSAAPEFERWVDRERRRLALAAVDAAWRLVARSSDDRAQARRWAERALALAPYDEESLRRYLLLMTEQGRPATALRAFDAFRERVTAELELEPSAETRALVERIRAGDAVEGPPPVPSSSGEAPTPEVACGEPDSGLAARDETVALPAAPSPVPPPRSDAPSSPLRRWRQAAILGLAFALLAIGGWAIGQVSDRTGDAPEVRSLAVLPLSNLTGNPEQEYFVAGMHDALVAELGQVADLVVVSRQSVLRYRGSDRPLPAIARELGVDGILEGSVFRAGDSVRVTAQLVRASPEEHLWAGTYKGSLEEAFALQGEVARAVAEAVHSRVRRQAEERPGRPRLVNEAAQEAYLRGLYYVERHALGTSDIETAADSLQVGIAHLERAVTLDPEWGAAHAKLALAYHWLASGPFGMAEEFFPKSKQAALRALELDETEAQAHASLGFVRFMHDGDWKGAERSIRRAIELDPNAHHWIYAIFLRAAGRYDEAITHYRLAEERNPLSRVLKQQLLIAYYCAKRYDDAIAQAEQTVRLWPDLEGAAHRGFLGNAYSASLMHSQAIAEYERAIALSDSASWAVAGLAYVHARAGNHAQARDLLRSHEGQRPTGWAMIHAALGEAARAAAMLETAFRERGLRTFSGDVRCFPEWETLAREPRVQTILRELHLAP